MSSANSKQPKPPHKSSTKKDQFISKIKKLKIPKKPKTNIQDKLGFEINYKNLFKFTFPTILGSIFMAFYSMVDGFFVSNFINTNALASVNIIFPAFSIVIGIGIMFSVGASALIGTLLGRNKLNSAREALSSILVIVSLFGIAVGIFGFCFNRVILDILGASPQTYDYARYYLNVFCIFVPFIMMQILFQNIFITSGKPQIGLILAIVGGGTNIVLDYIFIVILQLSTGGAALATGLGMLGPTLYGLYYFRPLSAKEHQIITVLRKQKSYKYFDEIQMQKAKDETTSQILPARNFTLDDVTTESEKEDNLNAKTVAKTLGNVPENAFQETTIAKAGLAGFNQKELDDLAHLQLYLVKPRFNFKFILKTMSNGSSEMVTNLSVSLTTLVFNILAQYYAGADGIAAITIILYSEYVLNAILMGYCVGLTPLIAYNAGQNNIYNLRKIVNRSFFALLTVALLMFVCAQVFGGNIIDVFARSTPHVHQIAVQGMIIFSFSFLFIYLNILTINLFTGISNGKISALISLARSLVFLLGMLGILPLFFGLNGVWLAVPIAELLSNLVSIYYFRKFSRKFGFNWGKERVA